MSEAVVSWCQRRWSADVSGYGQLITDINDFGQYIPANTETWWPSVTLTGTVSSAEHGQHMWAPNNVMPLKYWWKWKCWCHLLLAFVANSDDLGHRSVICRPALTNSLSTAGSLFAVWRLTLHAPRLRPMCATDAPRHTDGDDTERWSAVLAGPWRCWTLVIILWHWGRHRISSCWSTVEYW